MSRHVPLPEIFTQLDLLDAQLMTVQHLARLLDQVVRAPSSLQVEIVSRALCEAATASSSDDALDIIEEALRRVPSAIASNANVHAEASHE